MTWYVMGYPFGQLGSAGLAVSPLLVHPSPLTGEVEKALRLSEHCSTAGKTSLCQHCFHHKSKTHHHTSCYEEN